MKAKGKLKIKIFSDGAKIDDFREMAELPHIRGFTTNPSLMKKAGVTDYESFIREVLPIVGAKPISFEVIADDFAEMKRQAMKLALFGANVYVKIPITNTRGESSVPLIRELTHSGVKVNVTAMLLVSQVKAIAKVLKGGAPAIASIFAGRIADAGVDPAPVMKAAHAVLKPLKNVELLWASPRELLNIIQAQRAGCQIITVQPDLLKKINTIGYDLAAFSLDTVKMFYDDAVSSGLKI